MARTLAALLAALALAGCAGAPRSDVFSFAVIGDTPYSTAEERKFVAMIERLDHEDLAFVVHVGDIKGGEPCTDDLYLRRRAQFDRSRHPFFYTPGDNEWTDCRGTREGPRDPVERLRRIREVFFADDESLGQRRLGVSSQRGCIAPVLPECGCGALPENRAWTVGAVRFVTLDVAGSDNNEGYDTANDREARCRNEGDRQWLERAVETARSPEIRALVVMMQANPWFIIRKPGVFDGLLAELRAAAAALRKPLLLVHGDTHMYRRDFPFRDAFGEPLPFLSRLETYGSPFVGWARVTVDASKSDVFSFEDHLFAIVP
ncbi:MAG: hypothetical protein ACM3SO_05200 [Betaproteobacteria bacterium]